MPKSQLRKVKLSGSHRTVQYITFPVTCPFPKQFPNLTAFAPSHLDPPPPLSFLLSLPISVRRLCGSSPLTSFRVLFVQAVCCGSASSSRLSAVRSSTTPALTPESINGFHFELCAGCEQLIRQCQLYTELRPALSETQRQHQGGRSPTVWQPW